ncbi:TetR/AcrR family transcriptional regulator [Staphylococcus lugdunensis]|uniref:TetR/AcrR family transcriptional regulator n=1 Tax=Staphylococcus lugdunensis TaxID=28035 RepID=A0A4Q9WB85_STALU|nr:MULTISPECIES: TetR/AcrR family transcriptional regulator C-terminal domain-containing protein [Staphylococcus]AMG61680.1 transcriptional regulator [Staphylococcus lugdunensis]ARJ12506.1 TetR family transcriptional regulator [Staphylococcus lugdunensis]AST61337.1 TetR/AcrR family transcriptional regulator [Staphylococcus lugdunensis]ATG69929.1 TetR/AcrR family transcriptional regulator [Staphylococcus lugdunensis]ATN15178.1 TetR/AcrR family transcriptional regulator [Staphylococcus lugdunens
MNIKDLRVVKTRASINKAFITLFFEKDFDTISIKEITEYAQVGRKTFYLHYIDKYDLLDQVVSEKLTELEKICEAKKLLGLQEGTQLWFEFFENNRSFFMKLFNISNASSYKKKLLHFIEEEFKKKVPTTVATDKGLDYHLYINFISNGIIGLLDSYLNSSDNTQEQEKIPLHVSRLLSLYDLA